MAIEKTYQPSAIEPRILAAWESAEAFKAGRPERQQAETYSLVIPPPNVTGSLHMGHALNNTLQDVLCRFERMRGKDVLWQPGTDHAGIATQMVVERQLAERQEPSRRELGRQEFLNRVWAWKEESGGTIMRQLRRLGASCDFSRERFTMDEGLSCAVRKVFVELYRQGLIYKDKRLVNWDPKFLTAISDIEVQQVEVKGNLWHLRYPIEGSDEVIVVATTRPETMLGDSAVAVHPDDERYKHLVGKNVILPLVGRRIPIVADDYSDPEKGSGAVKITPAHDFNDFEVGRRHDLPLINIFDPEARLALSGNDDFLAAADPLPEVLGLHGVERFAARKAILALLEERELVERIEPNVHMVPHGDRSNVVIEPYLTDQWYVDAATLAKPALAAVQDGRTAFIPKNWEKTYFEWLNNIQPWCISRQLWWGHQIPAWYGPDGTVFVEETEDEALAKALAHYVANGTFSDEVAKNIIEGKEQHLYLRRDEDVLDTWFSSALWPFSTLGWPDETSELKRYYPTTVLVTGFDIIFFWVARMMMMGLHFMGEVPFRDIYMHALVRDERGAKMSKSKGNVIDPLDLMDEFGADAVRFTLAAMAAQGRDIKLARQRIEGYRNFATKLWNATRFAEMNECAVDPDFDPSTVKSTLNRWIVSETNTAIRETGDAIEAFRFNDAASAVYRFVWSVFCDWYLELAKPVLQAEIDSAERLETRATVSWVLDQAIKLLHPFMPFITEELWRLTAPSEGRANVLALAPWPQPVAADVSNAATEIGWLIDVISSVRSVRTEMNVPGSSQIPLLLIAPSDDMKVWAEHYGDALRRLARLSSVGSADGAPQGSVQILAGGSTIALPIADVIDLGAERARLSKELAKLDGEIEKIDRKLGNADFLSRAKEEVIEEQRERREEAQVRRSRIAEALEQLSGASA
ncbi:valine--tRNA ligase [Terrihabitans sp. B22-R8]|uniref:valine--tRNA ligase n=1 Tax=Terrihabitans sp. B22-R8 TaxID=3425128 RepID=UPI00403D1257